MPASLLSGCCQVVSGHRRGWFDMCNLGAVLDQRGAPAPSCMRSSAVASQDHQPRLVRGRRDETGAFAHAYCKLGGLSSIESQGMILALE
jgi:hypothetical protein